MKVLLVCFLFSFGLCAQDDENVFNSLMVECYYKSETNSPIVIYDAVDGDVVDSLTISNTAKSYKLKIIEGDYGWFQIQSIVNDKSSSFQELHYESYWIKNKGLFLKVKNADENTGMYLYDKPTQEANRIHLLENAQEAEITEVSGLWAKVKFIIDNTPVEGWLCNLE